MLLQDLMEAEIWERVSLFSTGKVVLNRDES